MNPSQQTEREKLEKIKKREMEEKKAIEDEKYLKWGKG